MFSTGAWANDANGVTTTGLDDVDLWVGGLAEVTNLFGGLLGTHVQLRVPERSSRTCRTATGSTTWPARPGMNLRTQLEGNSFAEMIQRNTDGTQHAEGRRVRDGRLQVPARRNLDGTAGRLRRCTASIVADDPTTTDCDESLLLLRKPDGTIQYRARNTVDPSGINGQSVYNGTAGVDRVFGGNDNDTFWGGDGNDVIEGNGGDDVALGGDGNDIITDLDGADVLKGGPGNDAIDAGPGDDILMGGDGQDFINGGANDNETFAGPATTSSSPVRAPTPCSATAATTGSRAAPARTCSRATTVRRSSTTRRRSQPGNDIFVGQVGENDYDAEGGDDLMAQNAAIDRNAGAGGFDWAFHQYDTVGADDDMEINNNLVGAADPGGRQPRPLAGDRGRLRLDVRRRHQGRRRDARARSAAPASPAATSSTRRASTGSPASTRSCRRSRTAELGAGRRERRAAGCLPAHRPASGATATSCSAARGSDTITGRGGDDIIDGDRALHVRISVRRPGDPAHRDRQHRPHGAQGTDRHLRPRHHRA